MLDTLLHAPAAASGGGRGDQGDAMQHRPIESGPLAQQAMKLAYTQRPQDGSADAAVHLILAPSYVTYSAATVDRVMDFFRTDEVGGCTGLGCARPDTCGLHKTLAALMRLARHAAVLG